MSKARGRAIAAITEAIKTESREPPAEAICALIEDGLGSLERIACALEKIAGSQALRDVVQNK